MKKRYLSTFLACLAAVFLACPGSTAATSDEVYELWMQYTVINVDQPGIPDVEKAINAISVPRIGVKIHIVPVFIGDLPADTAYAVASGEKIDLINVGLTNDMSTLVSDGLLLPLDELLEERGKDALMATEQVSGAQKIGGVTYAVSQYPYAASCSGFLYNQDLAQKLGIDMHDGMSLQELERVGERLKEDDIYLTSVGLSSELAYKFFTSMETFGEAGNYGVILDPANHTDIINIFASEELLQFYQTLRTWREKGFLPDNPMLNESDIINLFSRQQLFCVPTNVNAGQMGNSSDSAFQRGIVRTSDILISTSSVTEFMLGIASTCKNPEAAMDFINLIYAEPAVADLLNYGIEGVDYVPVEGTANVITREGTRNEDGNRYGSGFVRFGDPMQTKIPAPLTDDYYRELQEWESSAHRSLSFGYSFDASEFGVEARSIARIMEEYLPILNVGLAENVEDELQHMNQALETAGINDIIKANQTQLQEYLKGDLQ